MKQTNKKKILKNNKTKKRKCLFYNDNKIDDSMGILQTYFPFEKEYSKTLTTKNLKLRIGNINN